MSIDIIVNGPMGEKDPPVIIGGTLKPRRLKNIQDNRQPCGSDCYVNKNVWMDSEFMEEILKTLK